jgi:hypothetical protein
MCLSIVFYCVYVFQFHFLPYRHSRALRFHIGFYSLLTILYKQRFLVDKIAIDNIYVSFYVFYCVYVFQLRHMI